MINKTLFFLILFTGLSFSQNKFQEIDRFKEKYGNNCNIVIDKKTQEIKRITGGDINFKNITLNNIDQSINEFLHNYPNLFNISKSEIQLKYKKAVKNGSLVAFEKCINGIPVWNSELKVLIEKNGKILFISSNFAGYKTGITQPLVSLSEAIKKASQFKNIRVFKSEEEKLILYSKRECFGDLFLPVDIG